MKYSEYQIWYHVYTSAISAMLSSSNRPAMQDVGTEADRLATYAVTKFKEVSDVPQTTQTPSLDIQGLVDKVLKDSGKK
jgi:hypothetical protein